MLGNVKEKEQSVFRLKGNQCKKVNVSLYRIISAFGFSNYVVYSLTTDEFLRLQSKADDSISYDEYNHTPLLINNAKLKSAKVVTPNTEEIYLVNNELVSQICTEFVLPSNYDEIFYTVEDYEDILESFGARNDINRIIQHVRKKETNK